MLCKAFRGFSKAFSIHLRPAQGPSEAELKEVEAFGLQVIVELLINASQGLRSYRNQRKANKELGKPIENLQKRPKTYRNPPKTPSTSPGHGARSLLAWRPSAGCLAGHSYSGPGCRSRTS